MGIFNNVGEAISTVGDRIAVARHPNRVVVFADGDFSFGVYIDNGFGGPVSLLPDGEWVFEMETLTASVDYYWEFGFAMVNAWADAQLPDDGYDNLSVKVYVDDEVVASGHSINEVVFIPAGSSVRLVVSAEFLSGAEFASVIPNGYAVRTGI